MSLLSVTVKKARYVSIPATQFNTYVTLKLQNVKSTTVTVKGPTPSWEQDFLFETNDINLGLLVEVWNKGVIWDRALGYHYLPLTSVAYNEQESDGRWVELEAQLMMRGGAVVGTTGPTGHALLLDCRFEPPFDAEGTGGADLQRKLDLLNGALDAERAEQARRQMQYIAHSGYSEDSDYTSDLNYPVGQHPNCSASQFRTAAHQMHTPQRSLEASRENSYERDEYHIHGDTDPLYYNSQPRTNRIDTWSQLHAQASVESAISWRTAPDWHSAEDQRRPSLERQDTLYDESIIYGYDAYTNSTHIRDHSHLSQQASHEEYFDSSSFSYPTPYVGDDPQASQQWASGQYYYDECFGLTPTEYENIVNKRRSSVVQLPQVPPKQLPPSSSRYSDYNEMAPYKDRPTRSRRTAASLPVTPSSTPKRGRALPVPPGSASGSVRSGRGRRLPRTPHPPPASTAFQHVPYVPEPAKTYADASYVYDGYGYQPEYRATATERFQDTNYNTSSYDDDGMQPFFDETPHATPPAAAVKTTFFDNEAQSNYGTTSEEETNTVICKILPQIPVAIQQACYPDITYPQYDSQYQEKYQYDKQDQLYQDQQPTEGQFIQASYDYQYQEDKTTQQFPPQDQYPQDLYQQDFYSQQQTQHQILSQQQVKLPPQQFQPQKPGAQQLQTTMMTGAATLGSLMAGGAKKLGSFFGAAAAAVAPPITQPAHITATSASVSQFTPAAAPVTPFTITTSVHTTIPSVAELPPVVPVSDVPTTTPITLPRTPSLRRQESIQRPPVRRTRTLPEAPDDVNGISIESAYEDDYHKTETDQLTERDRLSLERYHDEEYLHETIPEENGEESLLHEITSPLQKTSPIRAPSVRKPSVDSYHSQTPSVIDRKPSQTSFHLDETLAVTTILEDTSAEKSKVSFQVERTTYHEVPEESDAYNETEPYDDQDNEYTDDQAYDANESFQENEKFEEETFAESDEQYQDGFQGTERIEEQLEFEPAQPKLTPRQRWHRAYNKIVMQLNVSPFEFR